MIIWVFREINRYFTYIVKINLASKFNITTNEIRASNVIRIIEMIVEEIYKNK